MTFPTLMIWSSADIHSQTIFLGRSGWIRTTILSKAHKARALYHFWAYRSWFQMQSHQHRRIIAFSILQYLTFSHLPGRKVHQVLILLENQAPLYLVLIFKTKTKNNRSLPGPHNVMTQDSNKKHNSHRILSPSHNTSTLLFFNINLISKKNLGSFTLSSLADQPLSLLYKYFFLTDSKDSTFLQAPKLLFVLFNLFNLQIMVLSMINIFIYYLRLEHNPKTTIKISTGMK